MAKIVDENTLKQLSKGPKEKRRNAYKVEKYSFQQFYSTSVDAFNPFCVYVYNEDGKNVGAGSGPTIEASYESLTVSSISFKECYLQERNQLYNKIDKIESLINEDV